MLCLVITEGWLALSLVLDVPIGLFELPVVLIQSNDEMRREPPCKSACL